MREIFSRAIDEDGVLGDVLIEAESGDEKPDEKKSAGSAPAKKAKKPAPRPADDDTST